MIYYSLDNSQRFLNIKKVKDIIGTLNNKPNLRLRNTISFIRKAKYKEHYF